EIARLQDQLAKATADLQRSSEKPDELREQDQQALLRESEQAQRDLQEKCKVG
ncbi:unnamed protein product, partial [Symbiodinium microadriaticum]